MVVKLTRGGLVAAGMQETCGGFDETGVWGGLAAGETSAEAENMVAMFADMQVDIAGYRCFIPLSHFFSSVFPPYPIRLGLLQNYWFILPM